MKKKIIIGIIILVLIAISITVSLTAGKNTWTILHTKGQRIWLVNDSTYTVRMRWDVYVWDPLQQKSYLTYTESAILPGDNLLMPYTENIYLKISSSNIEKVEGTKFSIID